MAPRLFYLGVTHETAELAVRERLRCDESLRDRLLEALGRLAPERMILSTCERFEIYAHTSHQEPADWLSCLAPTLDAPSNWLAGRMSMMEGEPVARHLLRVAAGLESRIAGEPQILGQVRKAYLEALDASALGPVLSALGRSAIHTGKRVRHETPINQNARSIATVAVDHLARSWERVDRPSALIVGTGRLAGDVAASLNQMGVGSLMVASRQRDRAVELSRRFGGQGLALDELRSAIARVDWVVTCAAAPAFVVGADHIDPQRNRPVHIVDLGVPRNVDPQVTMHPGVCLIQLDELLAGEGGRQTEVLSAHRIVAEEFERFTLWRRARSASPLIAEWLRKADAMASTDRRAVRRLLHPCIRCLKEMQAA